jgi:hypothetical protein
LCKEKLGYLSIFLRVAIIAVNPIISAKGKIINDGNSGIEGFGAIERVGDCFAVEEVEAEEAVGGLEVSVGVGKITSVSTMLIGCISGYLSIASTT